MNWNKEKAIVIGGGGFLGRHIVEKLMKLGCASVKSFGRSPQPELESIDTEVVRGDIRDADAVEKACKGCSVVFYTAAKAGVWGSWREYYEINVLGAENVADACKKHGIAHLVYTSSPSVAYPPTLHIENINESYPLPEKYLAHYPHSKALAEQLILSAAGSELGTIALRPHLIWGPRDPHLLPRVIDRAKKGRLMIVGDGTNLVDLTYVENAAYAHVKAAEALFESRDAVNGKAYFISDDAPVNLWDWINGVLEKLSVPPVKKSISYKKACAIGAVMEMIFNVLHLPGEPPMTRFIAGQLAHSHYFDISAAKNDFGYAPITPPELAMEKTIKYLARAE